MVRDEGGERIRNRGKHRRLKTVLSVIIVVCILLIAREYFMSAKNQKAQENLRAVLRAEEGLFFGENTVSAGKTLSDICMECVTSISENSISDRLEEPVMQERFKKLYEENSDLTAWLSIDGMVIDYPVMQCEDDEYYLHHDFYGNESEYGCLYVRSKADVSDGDNFIIYGHNMRDGSMFGDLDLYREKSFYSEHSVISFNTLYDEYLYEIVAVFLSQVYQSDDDVFKYYKVYEMDTEEEFNNFYKNIKELSLYDTGVDAEFGDKFLTLSTCAYHVEDGRFVVVAKRLGNVTLESPDLP